VFPEPAAAVRHRSTPCVARYARTASSALPAADANFVISDANAAGGAADHDWAVLGGNGRSATVTAVQTSATPADQRTSVIPMIPSG